MKSRQQEFQSQEYDRPNHDWVCGGEASGMPCPLGPTRHGVCQAICTPRKIGDRYHCENACETAGACDQGPLEDGSCCQMPPQCQPSKKGGSWQCTRGQCLEGPRPDGSCCRVFAGCKPTRSVLGKRRLLVNGVFGLAIGGLLLAASTDRWHSFFSPGPLTSHHHTISDCTDCHTSAEANAGLWVEKAFSVASRHDQNAGCQKCHADQLGPNALLAHGLSESRLAALQEAAASQAGNTQGGTAVSLLRLARQSLPTPDQHHDCATCHTEHRGAEFDIKHLSDSQCQVCHQSTFHSFNDGHPEFSGYPYSNKPHLYFDHASHFNQHFIETRQGADAGKIWECRDCHEPDLAGRSMVLRPYEQTCAACHDQQIHNAQNDGIEFFALPAIDTSSLNAQQSIGDWPSVFPVHVQARGALSPLMTVLLSTEEGVAESMQQIDSLDLFDLSSATAAQQQAVVDFAWEFKQALATILSEGRVAFQRRLADALGTEAIPADTAGQFYEQLQQAQQQWLPRLQEELQLHQSDPGSTLEPVEIDIGELPPSDRAGQLGIDAGWYLQAMDLSVRYRPARHADAWLRTWIDSLARLPNRADPNMTGAMASRVSQRAWSEIGSVTSPGRCFKCHTATDDRPDGLPSGLMVRWNARDESSLSGKMTLFDHQPHLTGVAGECQTCHRMDVESVTEDSTGLYRKSFVNSDWMPNTDPHQFVSDFAALSIASCAECHSAAKASNRCLTCHPYHVRP